MMSLHGRKLQTKSISKKKETKTKEETAEKVKAIREKQSLWMKEREETKSSSTKLKSLSKDITALPDVPKFRTRSSLSSGSSSENAGNRNPYNNPRRKPLYPEPQRDHSDVVSWISKGDNPVARKQRPPSASGSYKRSPSLNHTGDNSDHQMKYAPSNYANSNSSRSLNSSALTASQQTLHNRQRPLSRTSVKSESNFQDGGQVDRVIRSDDSTDRDRKIYGDTVSNSFSNTAVNTQSKDTLVSATSEKHDTPELSADMLNALADTVTERLKASLQPSVNHKHQQQNTQVNNESGIASHSCPLCEKLMTGPRHTPMAAIPCGHTYCQACLRDCKKCPTCQTVVKSTAVNTVMQQIISDFKVQKEKERLQKLEEQTRQYVEEYQSLALRCNALNGEAESILQTMEEVTEQLLDEKKLIKKLDMDENELRQKINRLQTELDGIKIKEEDCKERCQDLEQRYNEEKERLSMVEDTVQRIKQSKERVKMMVHNFAPALNLDAYD